MGVFVSQISSSALVIEETQHWKLEEYTKDKSFNNFHGFLVLFVLFRVVNSSQKANNWAWIDLYIFFHDRFYFLTK